MSRTEYCVGFVFDLARDNVLLIRNLRPAWQNGLLNGIGGKVEFGEAPLLAMVRESKEEAGLEYYSWQHVATEVARLYRLDVFALADDAAYQSARSQTDELLERWALAQLIGHADVLQNLLLHVAIALDQSPVVKPVMLVGGTG